MVNRVPASAHRRVAQLTVLKFLHDLHRLEPGVETDVGVLTGEMVGGHQPYPVVVHNDVVLFGMSVVGAAKASGVEVVEVWQCRGCEGLSTAELALKSAGLFLAAVRERRRPDPFDYRLMAASVYASWVRWRAKRPPRETPISVRKEREMLRLRLIKESFGRSRRSIERDVVLLFLVPELRAAVRDRRLPERSIEAAAKLSAREQERLAGRLAAGVPFGEVSGEFFGSSDRRRKTDRAAFSYANACIRNAVVELTGRERDFQLTEDDRPHAEWLKDLLETKLAAPPPADQAGEALDAIVADLKSARPTRRGRGAVTATGGAAGGDL